MLTEGAGMATTKRVILALAVLLALTAPVMAQQNGGMIAYGALITGQLDGTRPAVTYSFTGASGELALVTVIPASRELAPALILQDATTAQTIATSQGDQGVFNRYGASLAVRLPADGVYTLTVGSVSGAGAYVLRFDGLPAPDNLLPPGEPLLADITPEVPFQVFATAGGVLRLNATTADFGFVAEVFSRTGHMATLRGGPLQDAAVALPELANATYTVIVYATHPTAAGTVLFFVDDVGTEDVPVVSASGCSLIVSPESFGANVRLGPGLDFAIITTLPVRTEVPVTGRNDPWLTIQLADGREGWVFNEVGAAQGTCDQLPTVPAAPFPAQPLAGENPVVDVNLQTSTPFIPTDTPTPTPTNTPTFTPTLTATATFTPTATFTLTPTFTFTPTFTPTPTATLTPTLPATDTPAPAPTEAVAATPVTSVADVPFDVVIGAAPVTALSGQLTAEDTLDVVNWVVDTSAGDRVVQVVFTCVSGAATFAVSVGASPALTYNCDDGLTFTATAAANNSGAIRASGTAAAYVIRIEG